MYVSIDMDRLVFVHKCHDYETVAGLAHIELGNNSVMIVPAGYPRSFDQWTDLELKLLYRNTAGKEFEGFSKPHLQSAVITMTTHLPITDCRSFEVIQQAQKIRLGDKGFYKYAKGSYVAAVVQDLFTPPSLKVAPELVGAPAAALPTPEPDPTPVRVTTQAKPISAPKGGHRATIFEVADKEWESHNKPTDLSVVLAIRKTVMGILKSEHGIKRTTSSTALGDWQKLRLKN